MPNVTILMPVYNAMPYLTEAVESIRRQTLVDWRFVIVDDGSTDGSSDYLHGLADPRIEVLDQPNSGPAAAFNRGLQACRTEFVARMDADDISHPTRLAEQLAFLGQHPEVGLLGTQIEPLGTARVGRGSALATDHRLIFNELIHGRHAMCNPTVMCRTALLKQIGGYQPDGALEDWAMFLSMGEKAELANLDRVLLSYRIHAGSTNGRHMAQLRSRIAFACQRAQRRQKKLPAISHEQFMAARRGAPIWRRAADALDAHAMAQYRIALADILGSHPVRGYARLAWAASTSPRLTIQRLARVVRKYLNKPLAASQCINKPLAASQPRPWVGSRKSEVGSRGKLEWPRKHDLFGVGVSATTYDEAVETIVEAARRRQPAVVSLHAAHAVVTASCDRRLMEKVNRFEMVAPDGQPVRWALNLLYRTGLRDRVYGPELTLRLCRGAAEAGVPIYLYGGSPEVVEQLRGNFVEMFPCLEVAGAESPPFRTLSPEEDDETVRRINQSRAGIVFIGLGCPKQDHFAHDHRDRIQAVQVCVGAAFDFHSGNKKTAPGWMQRRGLEWLYRLVQEPRRLWRRYLATNSIFLAKLAVAIVNRKPRRAQ